MKRTLFALALLVPAFASAVVKLDIEGDASGSFVFTESDKVHTIAHGESGIEFMLMRETPEEASFKMTVKNEETVLAESTEVIKYGETQTFRCSSENVEVSISVTASQRAVVATETE